MLWSETTVWSTWQVTFLALIKWALLFHWEIALSPNKRFALFSHNNLLLQTISNSGVIDWHLRVPLKWQSALPFSPICAKHSLFVPQLPSKGSLSHSLTHSLFPPPPYWAIWGEQRWKLPVLPGLRWKGDVFSETGIIASVQTPAHNNHPVGRRCFI